MGSKRILILGGGLAGLSSALALAEAGFSVELVERKPHLGGRAASYLLPDGEHVDNCQHVTMACCTNLEDFYLRAGAAGKIRYYDRVVFLDRQGRYSELRAWPLPPPLHLAPSFLALPFLSLRDKLSIGRAMMHIAMRQGAGPDGDAKTMLGWLRQEGQSDAAIERVWRTVLVSALDEELDRASARYGAEVFWKAFLRNRRGFEIGIPRVPLGDLYGGCREAIERRGGAVRTRTAVRALRIEGSTPGQAGGTSSGARVAAAVLDDGAELTADVYISALPHDALLALLPAGLTAGEPVFARLRDLRTSPITGVHLWLDRVVTEQPYVALLDRTTQWVFNKTKLYDPTAGALLAVPSSSSGGGVGARHAVPLQAATRQGTASVHPESERAGPKGGNVSGVSTSEGGPGPVVPAAQYLQLVISASYDLVEKPRQEIVHLCWTEIQEAFPAARDASLVKSTVVKEVAATFSPAPGCDRLRPGAHSPIKNLYLAGDWTDTGWPSTMEGAVRSGYLAAEAIFGDDDQPRRLLRDDLPAQGFSRPWSFGKHEARAVDPIAIWEEVEAVIAQLREHRFPQAAQSLNDSLRCTGIRSELLGECAKTVDSLLKSEVGAPPELHKDLHRLRTHLKSELRKHFGLRS